MKLSKKINTGLIKGSLILLISFNIYNGLNFLFHFGMARLLSVADYGKLATLFSIIYVLGVFSESLQLVITKYATNEKDNGKLKNILKRALRRSFFVSFCLFIFYLIASVPLSYLLKVEYPLMALNGFVIFFVFLAPINRGIMQGKKKFKSLGLNMIIESSTKLALALVFVYLGWQVYGAIFGTLIGIFLAFLLSFLSIRDITKSVEKKAKTEEIYGYTKPVFMINLFILIFYNIDVLMARILFAENVSGAYAIASILAKTIFWGTQPISRAMFPIAAEKNLNKEKLENVLINAFAILFAAVIGALVLFYLFPEFIVKIFSGKLIQESIEILFYLGVAIGLLDLTNLILIYKLSLGKAKGYLYLGIFCILEIFLLYFFSANLFQFSIAFIASSAAFLWGVVLLVGE